jgi:hypothetical protein
MQKQAVAFLKKLRKKALLNGASGRFTSTVQIKQKFFAELFSKKRPLAYLPRASAFGDFLGGC